jgi:ATP-dependent DNA helicase RecQ
MWPTGLANLGLELNGRIADGASEGRAVARLTDLGHGQALRDLFRQPVDQPVPPRLAQAVMTVMKDWSASWEGRPVAVVHVGSVTRPTLVRDLAEGVARVMQLPIVGQYAVTDPQVDPGRGSANSAQRVAAVRRRYTLDLPDGLPRGPVLLVDDLVVTGWTLTLAATDLRAAGATAVLPLALAVNG